MRHHLLPLTALGWSLAAFALLHQSPSCKSAEPVFRASRPEDPDPRRLAELVLVHANQLESGAVGFAGLTPASVLAWRVIDSSPGAGATFREVFAQADVPGELYALTGLRVHDPEAYSQYAKDLRERGGTVEVVRGDVVTEESVNDVIAEIDRGDWTYEFTRIPAPPPPGRATAGMR